MRARVTLLPTQQTITVEEQETILDAALRTGLNLPHSCKAGHCSSCRARIVSGSIRYRDGRPLGLMESEAQEGFALLCQALPASDQLSVQVREIKPAPEIQVKYLPCRIEQLQPLADDIMSVRLRLPANETFAFAAGQYIDVMLPNNRRRSFSIANPPHDATFIELHVRRVANGEFTSQVFTEGSLKTLLKIEGPLGQFWFREDSPRPAILVGGGTGYAPLRSMLRHLLERGDRRPLHLYWGAQNVGGLYEDAMVREWSRQYSNLLYTPVVAALPENASWSGRQGWVHAAVLDDYPSLRDVDVYAAGPPAMVEAIRADFTRHGLPAAQLFFDSFDFAPDSLAARK
jgi:CDP-4-dehydro-6-deoxyglucose reductase, E3